MPPDVVAVKVTGIEAHSGEEGTTEVMLMDGVIFAFIVTDIGVLLFEYRGLLVIHAALDVALQEIV